MTTKQPTAQGISRLLAKAGFERPVSHGTRIRGWHDWNEGYVVAKWDEGSVSVEHRLEKWARGDAADQRERDRLAAYTKTLREAGYTVTEGETAFLRLIVTAADQTTAVLRPEAECSFCGEHITLLADSWTTDDGTIACTDTSARFVPHKPKEG
jgi:hypothetical protein